MFLSLIGNKIKKPFANLICSFVPSRELRHKIRHALCKFRPLINGANNHIVVVSEAGEEMIDKFHKIPGELKIRINGDNNTIKLFLPLARINGYITLGEPGYKTNNSAVEIQSSKSVFNFGILSFGGENQVIKIGKNLTVWDIHITTICNGSLIIGDDCLFSSNILIRLDDGHTVFDRDTKSVVNKQKNPLVIGNHCWIGEGVRINKNARIPSDTVIGNGSVVSGKFIEEFTAIAGNPAKVVKTGIGWDIRDTLRFEKYNNSHLTNQNFLCRVANSRR